MVACSGTHSSSLANFGKNVWGSHRPGWLWVVGNRSRVYLAVFATSNPQSTCHGPRPGPTLAPQCSRGLLRAPQPRAREQTRGRKSKKCRRAKKVNFVHGNTRLPFGTWFPRARNGWGEHKCLFDAVGIVLGHWLIHRSRGYDIYRRGIVSYIL